LKCKQQKLAANNKQMLLLQTRKATKINKIRQEKIRKLFSSILLQIAISGGPKNKKHDVWMATELRR